MGDRPQVANKRAHKATPYDVYIGRPSKWGNPFVIGKDGNRSEVIRKYRAWALAQPDLVASLPELRGKTLVCWCKPAACHGDVLAELCDALPAAPTNPRALENTHV